MNMETAVAKTALKSTIPQAETHERDTPTPPPKGFVGLTDGCFYPSRAAWLEALAGAR